MDAVEFFQTVNRLCKNRCCTKCPLYKNGACMAACSDVSVKNIEETISKVEQWAKDVKFCPSDKFADKMDNWNDYRTSNVRGVLSDMANAVFAGKGLFPHTVDLVADNGDGAYGTARDFVFILTCDEYRKYRDYIPHYDRWIWTATPWSCGDKNSDTGVTIHVRFVDTDGQLDANYAYFRYAVAPACILNPKSLNLRQSGAYVEEVSE